jgi:integrase
VSANLSKSPAYRRHRDLHRGDRAYVVIGGRRRYLGRYGSPDSRQRYNQLVSELKASAGAPPPDPNERLTVIELVDRFLTHADSYYGKPETANFTAALKPLVELYPRLPAVEFSPLKLKAVRQRMIEAGLTRKSINKRITRIRYLFKWGSSEELVPAPVHVSLATVTGLRAGRTQAVEAEPVKPVPPASIEATLEHLSPVVAAMVRLQPITGMRAGELVMMRGVDLDRTEPIWTYSPTEHKTTHHGHDRTIYLGGRAQAIITPWLKHGYLFRPADAEAWIRQQRAEARETPDHYGNRPGTNAKRFPKRRPKEHYTVASYRRAIARAADRADKWAKGGRVIGDDERIIGRWHPHQLRHNAATELRKRYGLEGSQVILGHRTLSATQIYAEKSAELAMRIVEEVG